MVQWKRGGPQRGKYYQAWTTLKKFFHRRRGFIHICLSANVPRDPSDTDVSEQEVTQPCQPSEKEMTPQQLQQLERIQKSNPNYVNTTIT